MFYLLRPFRFLAKALTDESTPRQLALGFAFGLVVGLVPKGNLTAIALMIALCATRINLGAGMLSAFLFSWLGMLIDPLTHQIGFLLLTAESLRSLWTCFYNIPVMPWTDFNNTIVLGSLVLGLMLFYPAYRTSLPFFDRYTSKMSDKLKKFKLVQLLWGTEWAGRMGRA